MSERFAVCAGRLAGLVPRALGWRPADFWDATPAELAEIFCPAGEGSGEPLSRSEMQLLMERDDDGR